MRVWVAVLLVLGLLASPARAMLIGIDHDTGALYSLNTASGAGTPLTKVEYNGVALTGAIGITFVGNTLYTITDDTNTIVPRDVFSVNLASGVASLVGSTGLTTIREGDLAYDPFNGVLYAGQSGNPPVPSTLFTVNPSTGAATLLTTLPGSGNDFSSLVVTPAGTLLGIDDLPGTRELDTINTTTGLVSPSVSLAGNTLGERAGLAYDASSGTYYYADDTGPHFAGTHTLYRFDPSNGQFTSIGSLGAAVTNISGLAVVPAPEPRSLLVLTVSLAAMAFMRRVRSPAAAPTAGLVHVEPTPL